MNKALSEVALRELGYVVLREKNYVVTGREVRRELIQAGLICHRGPGSFTTDYATPAGEALFYTVLHVADFNPAKPGTLKWDLDWFRKREMLRVKELDQVTEAPHG